jgi:hypothetical protein
MLVELTNDDCNNGDNMQVWLWRVVRLTVKAMASSKPAIAEREVWGHVRQGFELRQLNPIDPKEGRPIEGPGHLAKGVVTFAALSEWGLAKGYEYRMTVPAMRKTNSMNGYNAYRDREDLLNGAGIDWQYWTGRMPILKAADAARLMSGLDPSKYPNLNEKPGRGNPSDAIENTRKIQGLAEAQGISEATPTEWVAWAMKNDMPVFPGFLLPISELIGAEDGLVKVGAVSTVIEQTPRQPWNEPGLNRRERQIRVIEALADEFNYPRTAIPDGGKLLIEKECKSRHINLFGVGDDPFKESWQKAVSETRIRMMKHEQYSKE